MMQSARQEEGGVVTRRGALCLLAAGVAGGTLLPRLAAAGGSAAASSAPIERIGLQLYTVRRALAKDLEGTLAAIAAAGVRELEFAGFRTDVFASPSP